MEGYVKVYRIIMDSPIWQDTKYLKLWMYCLLKATHKEQELLLGNQKVYLKRGQFITGRKSLALELNRNVALKDKQSELSWWRYLNNFEKWGMLDIKKTNKYSLVTIINWDFYQETEKQKNINRTTNEQQMNTNKNVKNEKNEKKNNKKYNYAENVSLNSEEYQKLVQDFGETGANDRIETLDLYKGSTGKRYKSDYLTILSWERKNNSIKKGGIFKQGNVSKKRQQKKTDLSDDQKEALQNWEEDLPF